MIEVEGLIFDYAKTRALDSASFKAPAGEITALVGANGAGKTTLMRILAGLQRPQTGQASVCGVDVAKDPRKVHSLVGFLPDFIGLYEALSGSQHLRHAGACAALSGREIQQRIDELAKDLHIEDLLERKADELSRGQRQRLAIGVSLMKRPKLLILDEPASGLDPDARKALSDLLLRLKREGATLLVSSHILSELDDYSDNVAVMKDGRVTRFESLSNAAAQMAEVIELRLSAAHPNLKDKLEAAFAAANLEIEVEAAQEDAATLRMKSGAAQIRSAALAALVGAGFEVENFSVRKRRLQDAYFAQEKAQ